MANSFRDWQDWQDEHFQLPPEIEKNVLRQADTFNFFGRVVELFVPNAMDAVINMFGGGNTGSGRTDSPDAIPDWRIPPRNASPSSAPYRLG